MIPEFNLEDESTWVVIAAPPVDPSFQAGLKEIAGLNPYEQPILRLVWGGTHRDEQDPAGGLKYWLCDTPPVLKGFEYQDNGNTVRVKTLAEVPTNILMTIPKYESVELGERRWKIEIWHSPLFLERSGRYSETHDTGDSEITISCRGCGGQMRPTGREDERVCIECGSRRQSIVEIREIKNEQLLKEIPSSGVYDHFMTLQTKAGKYHAADDEALEGVRRLWNFNQQSFKAKDAVIKTDRAQAADRTRQARREVWHPDNLMTKETVHAGK